MMDPLLVIVVVMALERVALVVKESQEVHPVSGYRGDPGRLRLVSAELTCRDA